MPKISHQFIIFWLSISALLHNILMNGANNVIISSLQKEFYLSSRETGIYVSVYDIGSLLSTVFISVASAKGSKPRWIAFGMCMLFIGCTVNVLPHFVKPRDQLVSTMHLHPQQQQNSLSFVHHGHEHDFNETSALSVDSVMLDGDSIELCNFTLNIDENTGAKNCFYRNSSINDNLSNKSTAESVAKSYGFGFQLKHLLYVANMINGMSSASMTTIVFSYIEDFAPHSKSAIYEGTNTYKILIKS
jgi:hypothetical protein